MKDLSHQKRSWEEKLSETQNFLDSLPAHSLLIASGCTYLGCLPSEQQEELWTLWIKLSNGEGGDFRRACTTPIRESFSLQQVLATEQEILAWKKEEVFPDSVLLDKVLMWQARREHGDQYTAQIVFDPHRMYDRFARAVSNNNDSAMILSSDQADLMELIVKGLQENNSIVVHVKSLKSLHLIKELRAVLTGSCVRSNAICLIGQEIPIPDNFYFDIVIPCSPTVSDPFIDSVLNLTPVGQVTTLECSRQGLSAIFLQCLLHRMRKELCVQQRALLADLSIHKQEVQHCQEQVLSRLTGMEWSGTKLSNEDKSFINEIEKVEYEALQQIKETCRALSGIEASMQPYQQLANHATMLFTICSRLAVLSPQATVTLPHMKDVLLSLVPSRDGMRYHDSQNSLSAFLTNLTNSLTKHVHQLVRPGLFKHQQLLLPLMVTLGPVDPLQIDMLLHPMTPHLLKLLEVKRGSMFFHDRSLYCAMLSEKMPIFRELNKSFMYQGPKWQEYFLVSLYHIRFMINFI